MGMRFLVIRRRDNCGNAPILSTPIPHVKSTTAYPDALRIMSSSYVQLRHTFSPPDNARLAQLCGPLDENLRQIEVAFDVRLSRRADTIRVEGEHAPAHRALQLLQTLWSRTDARFDLEDIQLELAQATHGLRPKPSAAQDEPVLYTRREGLHGRTPNQVQYIRNILQHDITFGIGPAGTGKTFLAVACAVDALERHAVTRLVLTRPAVEAGERLGFLPGDLTQKVDPYLRPLYDALYDLLGVEKTQKLFDRGVIEIAPLAFMRGRTLNQAFIILDEAQNTTPEQMKMFLTRIGFGSRAVITGDTSQVDLPRGTPSGLAQAQEVLSNVRGIAFNLFTSQDVVRHPLVARIVDAYEAHATRPQADAPPAAAAEPASPSRARRRAAVKP
jgi:phosphate starvation-inducible PhoH-like protein